MTLHTTLHDEDEMGELGKRYKARMEAMIAELREHPQVYVAVAQINPGATAAQIAEVEQELGHALPDDVRDLYEEMNGAELIWRVVDEDEDRAALLAGEPDLDELLDYGCPYPGVVQWVPVERLPMDWSDIANFLPEDYDELFGEDHGFDDERKRICELNFFNIYYMAGLTFAPDGRGVVLIGDDHGACFSDHKRMSLPTYLELVIKQWGWTYGVREVKQMFGWTEDADPAQISSPTLEEMFALIRAEEER